VQPELTSRQDPIALARQNWIEAGWSDSANGMALVTSIMRVQQLLLGRIETLLRPHGLTFARFEVLRLLAFTRRGELPVGKIGERLQVHPASVTNAVHRLEEAGLVVRRTHPTDGRSVLAEITASGRSVVEACTELLNGEVFADIDADTAPTGDLVRGLDRLRRAAGDFD